MSLNELIPKELKVSTGSKFDGRHMYSKCLNCTQWWCCLITANVQSIVLPTFLRLLERRSSRSAPTQWRWRHFHLHLAQYILLLQLARTMVFFYLSHFTSKLAEACKSFLEQCTQRGYCWTFSTVFIKRTNNGNLCSCGTSWRLFHGYALDLVIFNGRDDGIGLVVNFLAPFQKRTRMFVIL